MQNGTAAKRMSNISDTKNTHDAFTVSAALLLSLISIPTALIIPLALSGNVLTVPISWAVCIISGIFIIMISRRASTAIILSMLGFLILPYIGSPEPVAAVMGLICSCGTYSALIAATEKKHIAIPLSALPLSYIIALIITREPVISLSSLTFFPPALAMGISRRTGKSREYSIAAFAITLFAELAGVLSFFIAFKHGALTADAIKLEADLLHSGLIQALKDAVTAAGNVPLDAPLTLEIEALASQTMNSLVGIAFIITAALGATAQKTEHSVYERFELEELQNISGAPMKASLSSALIFACAHIMSFTSSASNAPSFIASASLNISLIFMPIMLYVGYTYMSALPKKIGIFAIAAWIGLVIVSALLSTSVLSTVSVIGAACTLFSITESWAESHYGKGEDL